MSTNREVITDALVEIGVLDANETASIEDANLGLRTMNRMFALLTADGIDLGYPPQESLSDDFPLDDTVKAQIHYLLCIALRASFPSHQLSQETIVIAGQVKAQLLRDAVLANREQTSLTHMPLGERYCGTYDIATDE